LQAGAFKGQVFITAGEIQKRSAAVCLQPTGDNITKNSSKNETKSYGDIFIKALDLGNYTLYYLTAKARWRTLYIVALFFSTEYKRGDRDADHNHKKERRKNRPV
jgi:hypothetical protein